MGKQRDMFQMKELDKIPVQILSKMEVSKSPDKEFKVMVVKMFNKLRIRMDEHTKNFNKEKYMEVQNGNHRE